MESVGDSRSPAKSVVAEFRKILTGGRRIVESAEEAEVVGFALLVDQGNPVRFEDDFPVAIKGAECLLERFLARVEAIADFLW